MASNRRFFAAKRRSRRSIRRVVLYGTVLAGLAWLSWRVWTWTQVVPVSPDRSAGLSPLGTGTPPVVAVAKQDIAQSPRTDALPSKPSATALVAPGTSAPPVRPAESSPAPSRSVNTQAPTWPRGWDVVQAQVALAQRAISPGSIDGVLGPQTQAALRAFQQQAGLPVTGLLDAATRACLIPSGPVLIRYEVTSNDLARLQPVARSWLGKSLQTRLDYETILELVAEKSRAHPNLIRQLNPNIGWERVEPGTVLQIPNSQGPAPTQKAALVEIKLSARTLQAFGPDGTLLAHFPCSIGRSVDKRPVGELHVTRIVPEPDYTFDPEVFPESVEGRQLGRKLRLPPGPNNPVGTVWIGLDLPGYGIHGTPHPEQVGRTESHGCFRLANWNAEHLLQLVWTGMPVWVQP